MAQTKPLYSSRDFTRRSAQFPGHRGNGDVTVFSLIESPELMNESVLSLHGDGDDLGRLPLPTPLEDEVGAGVMAIVPGGFDEDAPGVAVTGFGNGSLYWSTDFIRHPSVINSMVIRML
jgi:hypothetical protein